MNYKKTLFFIGKCLTINHEEHNKVIIENALKTKDIDWEAIVKVSTAHYVFPALYCNLKKANFLDYLPEDLVAYMQHITDLNRERNQQIIAQSHEINTLLLAHNIAPIFLKGTGNLLEGLYDDSAERMVGDIDFLVAKDQYQKTVDILIKDNYHKESGKDHDMTFHWHYPPLLKENKIASVEVHKDILRETHSYIFNYNIVLKNTVYKKPFVFEATKDKILNTLLPKIINDNLYHSKRFSLRTMYDTYLLFLEKDNIQLDALDKKLSKKITNVLACIQLTLNSKNILKDSTFKKNSYVRSYVNILEDSKKEQLKSRALSMQNEYKDKFYIFTQSFNNKDYRKYALKRLLKVDFYKRLIGIKSNA